MTPILQHVLKALERIAPNGGTGPRHLATGAAGEDAAHFYLKQQGYTIVARNWRAPGAKDELDLVAYDGPVLCFVEVKTRSSRAVAPAEAAVDAGKRQALRRAARRYCRRLKHTPPVRFDILSVYMDAAGNPTELTLFRNAFPLA